jgi:uncharacterized protein YeaO (DUF488 family)
MIRVKRAYDEPTSSDGPRFLVDHLWPRGLKKNGLQLRDWVKDVAPSTELRKWFAHDPAKWKEFQRRYFSELNKKREAWQPLSQAAHDGDVTLVFAARDLEHNNAVALKNYLEGRARKLVT